MSRDGEHQRRLINEIAARATEQMHRENSEIALRAAVELMLTDHSASEVIAELRHWADYLDERRPA